MDPLYSVQLVLPFLPAGYVPVAAVPELAVPPALRPQNEAKALGGLLEVRTLVVGAIVIGPLRSVQLELPCSLAVYIPVAAVPELAVPPALRPQNGAAVAVAG